MSGHRVDTMLAVHPSCVASPGYGWPHGDSVGGFWLVLGMGGPSETVWGGPRDTVWGGHLKTVWGGRWLLQASAQSLDSQGSGPYVLGMEVKVWMA